MSQKRISFLAIALSSFLALTLSVGLSSSNASAQTSQFQTQKVSLVTKDLKQNQAAVQKYWTKTRMQNARSATELIARILSKQEQGLFPKASALARPKAVEIPRADYSKFPYSTVGKVFFTDTVTGDNYVCSATAVQSGNKSTVDTAGHCIADGGSKTNYYTNWVFCPQYFDGECTKGKWTARKVAVASQWIESGSSTHDLGAVALDKLNGKFLTDVVGGVKFGANLARGLTELALGYPAAPPFNGNRLQSCTAPANLNDPLQGTPKPIGMRCNMTGGSSGGGWLVKIDNTWYVNGHNDYGYLFLPNVMWSPYFGDDSLKVYNSIQNS